LAIWVRVTACSARLPSASTARAPSWAAPGSACAPQVGYFDPATGKLDPTPVPWRRESAAELIKAISLLQSNILRPNAQTLAPATANLDASYKTLAENASVTG
jgi:hypothetical protein